MPLMPRPRYTTSPLPSYSYVPGHTPHPVSDPRGHMHGHVPAKPEPLDPDHWQASETYRYAADLFNHGYHWEAHEAWESLWHAAGRTGPIAIWLKALIKLAAAAVKLREGNAAGATRHANRALELLNEHCALQETYPDQSRSASDTALDYCGLKSADLAAIAEAIVNEAASGELSPQPNRLLDQWLRLDLAP